MTADSLRAFVARVREGLDQTTVYHRFSELLTFLARNGIEVTLAKGDRPKRRVVSKDGTDIETYSDEDIRKLLAACRDEREGLIVLVASESGMRRGEIAHWYYLILIVFVHCSGTPETAARPEESKPLAIGRLVATSTALVALLVHHVFPVTHLFVPSP